MFDLCFVILHLVSVISLRKRELVASLYSIFNNLSMKYLVMCKVYTDVGGIN